MFLHDNDKYPSATNIDHIISAEISDDKNDPIAFKAIQQFIIYDLCRIINSFSPCMMNNKCTKHFPKKFNETTMVDSYGFSVYQRRNDSRVVETNRILLDNRYVVPYNVKLLIKYQAHMNVEWCNHSRSIKYLFKYVNKSLNQATIILKKN